MLRRSSARSLTFLATLVLPRAAAAQEEHHHASISEYRHTLMHSMQQHNAALRAILSGEVPFERQAAGHARAIRDLSLMLGDAFPEGSQEGSHASPEVWNDPEGFQAKLDAFQAAAARLAYADDPAAMRDATTAVGQGCRGCHQSYRLEDESGQ